MLVTLQRPGVTHYAQVIVRGKTYIQAVQKMQRALYEMQIRGVKTNIGFLQNVLKNPEFVSGMSTTSLIDRNPQLISNNSSNQPDSSKLLEYLGGLVCPSPPSQPLPSLKPPRVSA